MRNPCSFTPLPAKLSRRPSVGLRARAIKQQAFSRLIQSKTKKAAPHQMPFVVSPGGTDLLFCIPLPLTLRSDLRQCVSELSITGSRIVERVYKAKWLPHMAGSSYALCGSMLLGPVSRRFFTTGLNCINTSGSSISIYSA